MLFNKNVWEINKAAQDTSYKIREFCSGSPFFIIVNDK